MNQKNKGFVVSAVLYPLLVLFLALIMGLLAMTDTRKRILDKMKLEISDSIFDEATCSCDTILNKLNYLIKNGVTNSTGNNVLNIKRYELKSDIPLINNNQNDIAIVSELDFPIYKLSTKEPDKKVEGMLWIEIDELAPFYLVSDYNKIPIANIYQYQCLEECKWVKLESYLYTGEQWEEINYDNHETALSEKIMEGYTANVNGVKIIGNMSLHKVSSNNLVSTLETTRSITSTISKGQYLIIINCNSGEYGGYGKITGCDNYKDLGYANVGYWGTDDYRKRGGNIVSALICDTEKAKTITMSCVPSTTYNTYLKMSVMILSY